jgi:hypothetical protein
VAEISDLRFKNALIRSIFDYNDRRRARVSSLPCTVGKVFGHLALCRIVVDPVLLRDLAELIFGILLEDIRTERPAGFTADTPWPIDSNPHH